MNRGQLRTNVTDRVKVAGVEFHPLTEHQVVERVLADLPHRRGGWVCTVNTDILRHVSKSDSLAAVIAAAELVLGDGMPVLWANRIAGGSQLPERVAGSTLVNSLSAACAASGHSVFLLGGNPSVAERAAEQLQRSHPGLRVAGTFCPPMGFETDPAEVSAIEHRLRAADPDVVYIALSFPKQARLALALREVVPGAWLVPCGIGLSFVTGDVARAPAFMQALGLEWFHRLVQEPRRLARRYLVEDLPFFCWLMGQAALTGARRQLSNGCRSGKRTAP